MKVIQISSVTVRSTCKLHW